MDMWDKAKRSDMMSRIRSRGNKTTELRFLSILRANGISGWRRHGDLPGKPDFFFSRQRIAVFLDGCFWHGCAKCYKQPTTNSSFWIEKLRSNKRRDRRNSGRLRALGFRVIRIWEHSLRSERLSAIRVAALRRMLLAAPKKMATCRK